MVDILDVKNVVLKNKGGIWPKKLHVQSAAASAQKQNFLLNVMENVIQCVKIVYVNI